MTPRKAKRDAHDPANSGSLPGRRERNKLDKLERIKNAARALFIEKSFDEATTREIAARAGVGMGTIFLYADNKRDLLFLIANDDLAAIADRATQRKVSATSPLAAFMYVFRLHYEFFGEQPQLSRSMLREMTFYDSGKQAMRFQTIRAKVMDHLRDIAVAARQSGQLNAKADPALVGWLAFSIYQVELRQWLLAERPSVVEGLKRLEKALKLLLQGAAH